MEVYVVLEENYSTNACFASIIGIFKNLETALEVLKREVEYQKQILEENDIEILDEEYFFNDNAFISTSDTDIKIYITKSEVE